MFKFIEKMLTLIECFKYHVDLPFIWSDTKKNETNPVARNQEWDGERQTDGYRICSDLSQCYKAQLDRFTQYKWTHLQI